MSWSIAISLSIGAVLLLVLWIKNKYSYWKERGFESVDGSFPFGSLKGVGFTVHFSQVTKKIYDDYKGKAKAVGLYFFTSPTVLLIDLDVVKHVLIKDFHNFSDRGLYVNAKSDPLSAHLFAIEGQEWKTMRSKLSPTFTSGKMKQMFPIVASICDEMITFLKNSKQLAEIEMKDVLTRFTTDVIGNVAFGLDVGSINSPQSEFRDMGIKVFNPPAFQTMKVVFLTAFRKYAVHFGFRVMAKEVSDFYLSSIKKTVDFRESNNVVRNDFLNLLIELKNNGKLKDENGEPVGKITQNELAAQAFLFFIAGFETSSTTMTFALYELALNQDVQSKLRDEIRAVLAEDENKMTYDGMKKMKYLQMVLDETLRMYPPVDNLIRIAANDYQIPDTKLIIEKGTLVLIPAYAIQNNAEIYENPAKFDPERFSDENKLDRHPMAHLPFGQGNRNCIGLRFGLMQAKVGLIQLLLNFKFLPSQKTSIPMEFNPRSQVMSPKNNMWLKVEKIH